MTTPPATLTTAARPGHRIGHRIEVHEAIGSTNDRARDLLAAPDGEGVAVVAERQVLGRGRRGRTWVSPSGLNLLVSVGLRPRLRATDGWQLGQAAALAARRACAVLAPIDLKWPNDLVDPDGRKLGGLLVETAVHGESVSQVVIGVGINVNWRVADMPAELAGTATSLAELTGVDVDRAALLAHLLADLEDEVTALEAGRSPLDRYRAACRTLGSRVEVDLGGRVVRGIASDLDPTGALVLATGDGPVTVTSGEVVRSRPVALA